MPRWSSAAGAVRLKRAGHAATGVPSGPGPENAGSRLFAAEGGHGDRRGSAGVGPGAVGGVQVSGGRAAGVEEVRRAAPGPFDDHEVIRVEAGMSTSRFCRLIDMPERTWRRWQARAHAGAPVRGPWPTPTSTAVTAAVVAHAEAHPAWGHRKVWAMCRYGGQQVSPATVLRIMRGRGLLLAADYQAERRQPAAARRAVFVTPPDRPNRVWQLDFSEFGTTGGGTWRIAACTDYYSKYELGWHLSLTATSTTPSPPSRRPSARRSGWSPAARADHRPDHRGDPAGDDRDRHSSWVGGSWLHSSAGG